VFESWEEMAAVVEIWWLEVLEKDVKKNSRGGGYNTAQGVSRSRCTFEKYRRGGRAGRLNPEGFTKALGTEGLPSLHGGKIPALASLVYPLIYCSYKLPSYSLVLTYPSYQHNMAAWRGQGRREVRRPGPHRCDGPRWPPANLLLSLRWGRWKARAPATSTDPTRWCTGAVLRPARH